MKDKQWRPVKILLILLFLIVVIAVLRAKCELKKVMLIGTSLYTPREMWNLTQSGPLDIYTPFYVLNVNRKKDFSIPFIDKVEAKMRALDYVEITVYEKDIIGCVYAMGGYFYYDRDGLVSEFSDERLEGIVLVEGADFEKVVVGKNLKVLDNRNYFEICRNISLALEDAGVEADRIRFLADKAVVLYVGPTEIRLGKHTDYTTAVTALPDILGSLENRSMILFMENYSESNRTVVGKPSGEEDPDQ